jgi:hypothetical protein
MDLMIMEGIMNRLKNMSNGGPLYQQCKISGLYYQLVVCKP